MANYVTYYNGQRVEITQETLQRFLAGNPGDIGRVGSAFAGDDANLARVAPVDHPASIQVSTPGASYAPPPPPQPAYAPPTTETAPGPVGGLLSTSPRDGLIKGTMVGNTGFAPPASQGGAPVPTGATISLTNGGMPAWIWGVLAAVVVLFVVAGRK